MYSTLIVYWYIYTDYSSFVASVSCFICIIIAYLWNGTPLFNDNCNQVLVYCLSWSASSIISLAASSLFSFENYSKPNGLYYIDMFWGNGFVVKHIAFDLRLCGSIPAIFLRSNFWVQLPHSLPSCTVLPGWCARNSAPPPPLLQAACAAFLVSRSFS